MQNEELRRTELGLDAQREKYFHLFDLAPVGYLTLGHEGIVGDANLTAVRMLRIERQILFGQPFSAFVLPEDRDRLHKHFRALEKADKPQTCELRLQRVSRDTDDSEGASSQFWARLESRPQRTADGETLSTWVTFTDISGRKLAEAALRESEDKFRFFFNRSVVPKAITLPTGEVQVNDAFCAMLGYTPIELESKATWERLTYPADVDETRRQMDDLISGEKASARFEKRYVRKDGDVVWTDVCSSLRRDDAGQPLYFMTTILDITERKRAEESALQSAERHRAVIRTAMDGFWLMNSEGRLFEVNEALCEISGYSEKELLTMGVADLDVAEDADGIAAHVAKVLAEGEDRFETRHRRKDGSILDVEISTTCLPDNSGGLAVFVRDITADKQAAARLEGLLEEREHNLDQLAQSLSSIIEVVSQVVETRDPYTAGHERRVSELAVSIAQYMGMAKQQVEEIRIASLIHDVGKISVPTEILVKPGKLSPMEFELIKGHSEAGYRILA
jgi:PAS domain S-box-containing protein